MISITNGNMKRKERRDKGENSKDKIGIPYEEQMSKALKKNGVIVLYESEMQVP